jgi:hypothetical protein
MPLLEMPTKVHPMSWQKALSLVGVSEVSAMKRNRGLFFLLFLFLYVQYLPFCPSVGAGTVYFKSGKSIICEYAWIEGDSVYVVPTGKKFAISYDKAAIDTARSDINTRNSVVQEQPPAPSHPRSSNAPPIKRRTSSLPAPFQDLFPLKTHDRETFSGMVDRRLGGNPYFRDVNQEVEAEVRRALPELWRRAFRGRIPFNGRLNADQHNSWINVVRKFRAHVWQRKEEEIRRAKEIRDFLMFEFEMRVNSSGQEEQPHNPEPPEIRLYPASPP